MQRSAAEECCSAAELLQGLARAGPGIDWDQSGHASPEQSHRLCACVRV